MTAAEKKAFQHSYGRHFKEFGLPDWKQLKAAELQIEFNTIATKIRTAGKDGFFKSREFVNGKLILVNRTEPVINGQRYYYYETYDGKFVSAGKMPKN